MWSSLTVCVLVGLLSAGTAVDLKLSKIANMALKISAESAHNPLRGKRQTHEECGVVYTKPTDYIQSENYPADYGNNVDCDWTIRAPVGNVIELTFADPFEIERPNSVPCDCDELAIFDGGSSSPQTVHFCSANKPNPITTETNEVYLTFHTDGSLGYTGFRINYRFIPDVNVGTGAVPSSGQCGDTLTSPTGIIKSHNYPEDYTNNYQCSWTITAPPGQIIEFTFVDTFRLEISTGCTSDKLEIHDGGAETTAIATVCGDSRPDPITTTSNVAFLRFSTDYSLAFPGFKINYRFLGGSSGGSTGGRSITLEGGTCQFLITPGPGCTVE